MHAELTGGSNKSELASLKAVSEIFRRAAAELEQERREAALPIADHPNLARPLDARVEDWFGAMGDRPSDRSGVPL